MNELKSAESELKEKQEIVVAEKKLKQVFSARAPKPGKKVFEFNEKTFELKEADIEWSIHVDTRGKKRNKGKIITKENCRYLTALNFKNAWRKIMKTTMVKPKTK